VRQGRRGQLVDATFDLGGIGGFKEQRESLHQVRPRVLHGPAVAGNADKPSAQQLVFNDVT
jgi:hypothetical protein